MTRQEEFERSLKKSGGHNIRNFMLQCADWIISDLKTKPLDKYKILDELEGQIRIKKMIMEREG